MRTRASHRISKRVSSGVGTQRQFKGPTFFVAKEDRPAIVPTSGPLPWPKNEPKETWHVEQDPNSEARIWLSSQGKIRWHPPGQSDTITFEERALPNDGDDLNQRVLDFETLEHVN